MSAFRDYLSRKDSAQHILLIFTSDLPALRLFEAFFTFLNTFEYLAPPVFLGTFPILNKFTFMGICDLFEVIVAIMEESILPYCIKCKFCDVHKFMMPFYFHFFPLYYRNLPIAVQH